VKTPLPQLVERLAADPAFTARIDDFYRRADDAIAKRRPLCTNRGACCKFATAGHRLYVTDVEAAFFLIRQRPRRAAESDEACPYQVDGLCTARDHRPLGCRIYFCDPASRDWQPPEYERRLEELKRIGEEFGIDYRYTEWLSALREAAP
jgi:Fe-S-cluster containining protein